MRHDYHFLTSITLILLLAFTIMQTARAEIMDHHNHNRVTDEDNSGHGNPADPVKFDRIIEVTAYDIAFEPASITVSRGETVKFVVTNTGQLPHELILGTKKEQMAHAEQMRGMSPDDMKDHMHQHGMDKGVLVQPGQMREFIWTFPTDIEQIEFACHIPGHYQAGMTGIVEINK